MSWRKSWREYVPALQKIEALQAEIDQLITEHIHAHAAEISGTPAKPLRGVLERRAHGYCRCLALKNIADE